MAQDPPRPHRVHGHCCQVRTSTPLVLPNFRTVYIRRVMDARFLAGKHRPYRVALKKVRYVHSIKTTLTQSCEVIFEVVGEMVDFACGVVMKFYIDDVMCILISHFNDSNHVICCSTCEFSINT
jgi:hypothetical protein